MCCSKFSVDDLWDFIEHNSAHIYIYLQLYLIYYMYSDIIVLTKN